MDFVNWLLGDGVIWLAMASGLAGFALSAVIALRATRPYRFDSSAIRAEFPGDRRPRQRRHGRPRHSRQAAVTVADLIAALREMPQEARVIVETDFEPEIEITGARHVPQDSSWAHPLLPAVVLT